MTTARLIICSPNGADIAVLADGAVVQPGPRLRCDAALGPVQFLLDGKEIRVENAPPFCPAGDSAGVPVPLDLKPGSHTLVAVAWATPVQVASAQFTVLAPTPTPAPTPVPVPTPVPQPTPTPPVMTLKRAPNAVKRGDGFTFVNRPSVALADTVVDGYEQNIIAQNIGPAGTRLTNVVSMNAHRASASDMFRGQALYLENAGPVALSGYAALFAGWQPGTDPRQRGGYFHGVYSNWGSGPLVIEDFILWGCAHSGAQLRAIAGIPAAGQQPQKLSAVLRRGVIIDCGSGVTAVAGNVALDDVVIYRGHRWHERDDRRNRDVWTGDIAVSAYTDTAMNDVLIVGGPGQDQPAYGEPATDARYDLGAVMGSRHYAPHPDVSGGAKWTVTGDCRIRAWPGVPFSGDAPCPAAGWRVDGRGPVAVNLDDLYRQLATGTRTVRDVRADLSKRIRDAAA